MIDGLQTKKLQMSWTSYKNDSKCTWYIIMRKSQGNYIQLKWTAEKMTKDLWNHIHQ